MSNQTIDTAKLENGLADMLGFLIRNNKTTMDDKVIDRITASLQKVKDRQVVTSDDFINGVRNTFDWITDVIPGTTDDAIIDSAVNTVFAIFSDRIKKGLDKYGK